LKVVTKSQNSKWPVTAKEIVANKPKPQSPAPLDQAWANPAKVDRQNFLLYSRVPDQRSVLVLHSSIILAEMEGLLKKAEEATGNKVTTDQISNIGEQLKGHGEQISATAQKAGLSKARIN
jgi:tyrosyl-tRNA synthetase